MDAPDLAIEGLWLETFPAPRCVPQQHVELGLGRSEPQQHARQREQQHRRGPGLSSLARCDRLKGLSTVQKNNEDNELQSIPFG